MNVNIYLDENLAKRVDMYTVKNKLSRSMLIRQALEQWLAKQSEDNWPKDFFQFTKEHEFPAIEEMREGLTPPKEADL